MRKIEGTLRKIISHEAYCARCAKIERFENTDTEPMAIFRAQQNGWRNRPIGWLCSSCDDGKGDLPSVIEHERAMQMQWPKARKNHTCLDCGGPILVGMTYQTKKFVVDGVWSNERRCMTCAIGEKNVPS